MIVYDDLESEKNTLNNDQNPGKLYQMLVGLPHRKMLPPQIDGTEALRREIDHFP